MPVYKAVALYFEARHPSLIRSARTTGGGDYRTRRFGPTSGAFGLRTGGKAPLVMELRGLGIDINRTGWDTDHDHL